MIIQLSFSITVKYYVWSTSFLDKLENTGLFWEFIIFVHVPCLDLLKSMKTTSEVVL